MAVQQRTIEQILEAVKVPLNHPSFYSRVFALLSKLRIKKQKNAPLIERIVPEEYEELSRHLERSHIQESTSVRNILRSREMANQLIDDKGEINMEALAKLIEQVGEHLYSLGPERQYDGPRAIHQFNVLRSLYQNKELQRLVKRVTRPLTNKIAEEAIRDTLNLPTSAVVSDAQTRRAVLSAWLSYLRQNIGSCFATAPAIMVQAEQPELFLQDLIDLVSLGRLKRTFGGIEYSVPISPSSGSGDLKKPLFLEVSSDGIKPEVWYSQGLIAAFEAAQILLPNQPNRNKIQQVKAWVEPLIIRQASRSYYAMTSAEQLIRFVIMNVMGLTEAQIYEVEHRPQGMIQGNLMMQAPTPSKSGLGSLGERVANFNQRLVSAYSAFKAIADNALLKTWEFSLASFSETKYQFAQWNLYASLGLQTNEPGGIGQAIYIIIQHKIDILNKELNEQQYEYEMLYTQVRTIESQFRGAKSEQDASWLKMEYQSRVSELDMLQERRDELQTRAKALVDLYQSLYAVYQDLFKEYFQEVYDADLHEVTVGPFDDSPAGFRLLFKHGRSNTSQWTRIYNQHDFVNALAAFFVATEPYVAAALEKQNVDRDLSEVVTAIINHVKTKEFIESAFQRMAMAHRAPLVHDPLNNLDKVEKKPWVYTSGGTMNTLVSCYYRIHDKPQEVSKWVENEVELLVFLADTLKHLPYNLTLPYISGKRASMLMQSPTHAFLLKPSFRPFMETWFNQEFTYTSVRDRFVRPMEQFVNSLQLSNEMIRFLIDQFIEKVPENYQPRFRDVFYQLHGPMNVVIFRDHVVHSMEQDRGLRYEDRTILSKDLIDSLLYSMLPLFPSEDLKERLTGLLKAMPSYAEKSSAILNLFEQIAIDNSQRIFSSKQLQDIVKALISLYLLKTTSKQDLHLEVSQAAQKLGFSMPAPVIFADTNWVKDDFGFVLSPGTGRLELWRVDYTGTQGAPMSIWKQWVNGTRSDQKWGVYVKPFEYGQT